MGTYSDDEDIEILDAFPVAIAPRSSRIADQVPADSQLSKLDAEVRHTSSYVEQPCSVLALIVSPCR
jgi:hypothetical protein